MYSSFKIIFFCLYTFSSFVSPGMQSQMVRPGEALAANFAKERSCSGVFPRVPGQLVRSRERVPASLPQARVRSLPGVDPCVRLQVGALRVDFATVGERAPVVALHLVHHHHRLRPGHPIFCAGDIGNWQNFSEPTAAHELESSTSLCRLEWTI